MANREQRSLSTPSVHLDGRRLKIVPNTCTAELPGESKVRAVSAGGGAVEMVHGFDVEAMVCTVKFDLPNTSEYVELAQDYAARRINGLPSTLKIVDESEQLHYDQMTLTNRVEIPFEPEGKISLEWMGRYSAVA